jgi:hypothetical protein
MRESADAAKVKVEFLQERLLPILETSAQDLFDEGRQSEADRHSAARLRCRHQVDQVRSQRQRSCPRRQVAIAGLLLRPIGAVKDDDTANSASGSTAPSAASAPRISTRLQMLSRFSPKDQQELAMELRRRSSEWEDDAD